MSLLTNPETYARALDCVHCGLCLSACPTYGVLRLETDSPRGRIYLLRALADGSLPDAAAVRVHLDQCLDCRACETACPSGVQFGRMLESARSELRAKQPDRGLAARLRAFALHAIVAHPRRLRAAFSMARLGQAIGLDRLAARLRLLPRGLAFLDPRVPPAAARRSLAGSYSPPGTSRGRVALFTGCVMEQMFGEVNRKTIQLLLANGFAVDVPADQACCGALHIHDGHTTVARRLATRNLTAFAGAETVVTNSAGCGAALRDYGHLLDSEAARAFAARCRDICAFLSEAGLTATPAAFPHAVAYDDPCHLCHAQGVRAEPRELLRRVPGLRLVPHDDPESCCGSAGIYNLVHPELAREIGARKAAALRASGAELVVTGNPGCAMQIRAHLRALGARADVRHPAELLLPADPPEIVAR
jgi:glycolate oxidase iron-sulfur subunit